MGPATADGEIYFTATHQVYGIGPPGEVSGEAPSYTVCIDDGYPEIDCNDVILSVTVSSPDARLSCSPSPVLRGELINCTVSGSIAEVTGWSFVGPHYDQAGYDTVAGPMSGNSWAGTAVASGTVYAYVSVNGAPQEDPLETPLTVQGRTGPGWNWSTAHWSSYSEGTAPVCLPTPPFQYGTSVRTGWHVRKGTCETRYLTPNPVDGTNDGFSVASVSGGPNAGLWYVTGISYVIQTESNINVNVTDASTWFYSLSNQQDITACKKAKDLSLSAINFYKYNVRCRKENLAPFLAGLWAHEGRGVANNSGHQAQLEIAAAMPANNLYRVLEGVFRRSETSVREAVGWEASLVDLAISTFAVSHSAVKNNWCGSLWRWNPATQRFEFGDIKTDAGNCI